LIALGTDLFVHRDTCNVYVLRTGREAMLVDCGDGSVLDGLAAIGVERVTDVLMTHHHRDQGQGLPRLARAGARIWVPHAEQDLFHSVDAHWQAREVTNSYNNREDRFSLLEPVPVFGTLKDYSFASFGGRAIQVVPTPGHTTGSISLVTEVDGRRAAFTGDLIAGPGQVWSLAATQWTYNGGEGIAGSILSLLDLKDRQVALLLPSHGEPMADATGAIDLTVARLADLRTLRRHNPRLFQLRERPWEPITPHLLKSRTSMAMHYALLSESGKALLIDFGYDFMFGFAAGADRASRRPWLYTIPALKRDFGVTAIDVVLPTHYHDDHVAGCNLLRDVEGAQVWAGANFADVLANPARYDLPCLWYDPIAVDRVLPLGEPVRWEEYELTLYAQGGHTLYAVAVAFTVDGKRVVAVGDQNADGDGLSLNYVYKNGFRAPDYRESAELYRRLAPDLMLSGHWEPIAVTPAYLDALLERGRELERFHAELLPPEAAVQAVIRPYQSSLRPGESVTLEVTVDGAFEPVDLDLTAPAGFAVQRLADGVFRVTAPAGAVRRARVGASITVGDRRYGQMAEALITVTGE